MTIYVSLFSGILILCVVLAENKRNLSPYAQSDENICISCSADDKTCSRIVEVSCSSPSDYNSNSATGYGNIDYDSHSWERSWGLKHHRRRSRQRHSRRLHDMRKQDHRGHLMDDNCLEKENYTCRYFKCFDVCCTSWMMDPKTQKCSIYDENPPSITCENGGKEIVTPEGPVCVCLSSYTGRNCDTNLCDLQCENEGLCDFVDGAARCICQEGFEGRWCEKPLCDGGCQNGGSCVSDSDWWLGSYCVCPDYFSGRSCEQRNYRPKVGHCPEIFSNMMVNAGVCINSCYDDNECHGDHKCCSTGCGMSCMMPADDFCSWNGTMYSIGYVFMPTSCLICTCYDPDNKMQYGGARCDSVPCPSLNYCKNIEAGECCDQCIDYLLTPNRNTYKEPIFSNCPATIIEVDLKTDALSADLPVKLKAKDYLNHKLDVTYSRKTFTAGKGQKCYHTVTATSTQDTVGKHALCVFQIRVKDRQPPSFDYCPSDISSIVDQVTWNIPVARDNVGLAIKPTSRNKPGDRFSKGEHAIVYKTEDYEGNVANCVFFVKILSAAESPETKPQAQIPISSMYLYIIGAGGTGGVILIVLSISVIYLKSRRISASETGGIQSGRISTIPVTPHDSQNIYTVSSTASDAPPAYDNINNMVSMINARPGGHKMLEKEVLSHPSRSIVHPKDDVASGSSTSFCSYIYGSPCRYSSNTLYQNTTEK